MIVLITGLPGAGKTLWALNWVNDKSVKESRPVFYSGISDLTLPWTEIQPERWMDAPANSIIVIDECQRVFRPRMHGATVPAHVSELETHRHRGIDIVLITQHPMLLDSNARRLVGLHFHSVRKFGTASSTVHEWASVKENCDKNRDDSTRHQFVYPKSSFTWYKSAEVHTHKARIPGRIYVIVAMLLLAVGVVLFLVHRFQSRLSPSDAPATLQPHGPGAPASSASEPSSNPFGPDFSRMTGGPVEQGDRPLTPLEYAKRYTPRLAGLEYTAPAYDELTRPTSAPYPAACVATSTACRCFSQQATRLAVPDALCRSIVAGGFFLAWDTSGRAHDRPSADGPGRALRGPSAALPAPPVVVPAVSVGASAPGPGVAGPAGSQTVGVMAALGSWPAPPSPSVDGEVLAWMRAQ